MIRLCYFTAFIVIVCCSPAFSQSSFYIDGNTKHTVAWDDMVGSIVEFDGMAWGAFEKGLGAHVVMPRNKVYLEGVNLLKNDFNGRLIRVAGVLRKTHVERAPKGAQGYSQSFEYFYVDAIAASRIDKVSLDQLLPTKDDWIVPGMSSEAADKVITARKFEPYLLALAAAKDGSETKSFLVSKGVVIVYRVLNGNVVSVSSVQLNGAGKLDDQWMAVRGFRLPTLTENTR